jgi:hypothetical protein
MQTHGKINTMEAVGQTTGRRLTRVACKALEYTNAMFKNLKYYFAMMKKNRKQDIMVVVFALILVIITFTIVIIITTSPSSKGVPVTVSSTPVPSESPPEVIYNSSAGAQLANKIIHRQTLSEKDAAAKTTVLETILKGDNSGIVFQTTDVRVEYVKSVDLFMAEILTPNIDGAKEEAVSWFLKQGFSQQAVCNLPVMFYLDTTVSSKLQQSVPFSPLANGC